MPAGAGFVAIAEADGTADEARAGQHALLEAMADYAVGVHTASDRRDIDALWRWRDGIGLLADNVFGGKISEDITVPGDALAEAITRTSEIGSRHGLPACSWGHAGDGNLHATFMFALTDESARKRASLAADELFAMAIELGGSISGEHGVGLVKGNRLRGQWAPAATALHQGVKELFDPDGLLNPGKKVA